jgi:hypothetical protein
LDPVTMEVILHSEPHEIDRDDVDPALHRGDHHHRPTRAFGSMFVTMIFTALPVVVSSLYLFGGWQQQQQDGPMTTLPSPSPHHLHLTVLVTLLAGLSALFLVLGYESSRLDDRYYNDDWYYNYGAKQVFLWCWTMGVGGAVALFCTVLMMTNDREISKNNNTSDDNSSSSHNKILRWGRNIGALVYFYWGGAVILLSPYSGDMTRNTILWIVFNAVIVAPLTVLGLISQSLFLLLLAAVGVLLDARHICLEYTHHVLRHAPWSIKALITVAIMGGTGIIVTVAITYWWLRHRYPDVLAVLIASLEPHCGYCGGVGPVWWCRHRRVATTVQFTIVPSRDVDEDDKDKFDYQQAPPISAAAVAKEGNDAAAKAAAGTEGMESLANMLRRWADHVDQVRLAHAPESGNKGAAVA